jgi:hypothetical protein
MEPFMTIGRISEQEKEIISILIDSSLYLDMDLKERCGLLRLIASSYFDPSAK